MMWYILKTCRTNGSTRHLYLNANLFDDGNDKHCAGKVDNFEIRALGTLDYTTTLLLDFDVVKVKTCLLS